MGEFVVGYVRVRYVGRRWCIFVRVCVIVVKGYLIWCGVGVNGIIVYVVNGVGVNE